jgi:MerR family transcriptional regulator, thiopeptide resistance regulator
MKRGGTMTYLSTGQLAKRLDVSVRTLRYYDQIGLVQPSKKGEGGRRFYSDEDILKLEKLLLLKALSLSLEDSKKILEEQSISSILQVHRSLLEEQLEALDRSLRHTNTLLNSVHLEGALKWEDLLSLVVSAKKERDWNKYFTAEEQAVLKDRLPKMENSDASTRKWMNLIKRIELCLEKRISPQSQEAKIILEDMEILSAETFQGDEALMGSFWEIRKSAGASEELGLYPVDPAIIEFIESAASGKPV